MENANSPSKTIPAQNQNYEVSAEKDGLNKCGGSASRKASSGQRKVESENSKAALFSNSYEDSVKQVQSNYGLSQGDSLARSVQVKNQKPKQHPGKLTDETNIVIGAKVNTRARQFHDDAPALPFISQNASMMPDMKFGWKPEVKCSHPPIPLYFDFIEHRLHPYRFGNEIENSDVIVYQQPRPKDSYQMHKIYANQQLKNGCQSYKFNFPKNHEGGRFNDEGLLDQIFGSRSMERGVEEDSFNGMNPECDEANKAVSPDQEYSFLPFDSNFESGNLDMVIKTAPQKAYDVFLRPDTNTTGYFQWFYFRVKNRCKGTKIRINIVNMTKRNSLYQQGMPIQILSMKKAKEEGANWAFGGQNIRYGLSKLMKQQEDYDDNARTRVYYQLGWEYTFQFDNDEVFFAYSLPYTFSMVTNLTQQIQESQDKLIQEYRQKKEQQPFHDPTTNENSFKVVETSSLTTSLAGMEVPMLTITDFSHSRQEENRKKVIVITGRVHPGETNASWIVHGIIKFLLGKDKVANELRKRVIFKIIPMINADGVTIGNSRCSLIGRDINRLFGHPNSKLTPEPFHLRGLVKELQKNDKHKVLAYLDVHAHSGRKSIFMYGPYFPLHSSKYMKIRTLPKLISERTEMFRYFSCKFKCEKYKENCARIAIWRDFNITNVYTIETSSMGFLNKQRDTVQFSTGLLQEFGECFMHSMFEYHLIQEEDRRMKVKLAKKLKEQRKTKRQTIAEILGRVPGGNGKTQTNVQSERNRRIGTDSQDSFQESEIINNINFNGEEPQVTNFNENPNEADNPQHDEVAQPVQAPNNMMPAQIDGSDESIDSRAFADSDSSDEGFGSIQINQINDITRQQSRLNSRYDQFGQTTHPILSSGLETGGLSQIQQMLMRKKGLDIIDGGELFHQLYNPSFQEWKSKRQSYVKYEQLQRLQKQKENRSYHIRYPSKSYTNDNLLEKNDKSEAQAQNSTQDVSQKQRDQYYMKEVRTFDEVFKAIKTTVKEKQMQRGSNNKVKKNAEDDGNEYDDEADEDEDDIAPLDDEYGNEEDFIDDNDDQEVDQQDREVLNDRILGIINVFGSIVQNSNNTQTKLNSNQMKVLQDLRQQSLSIEKQVGGPRKNTIGNKFEGSSNNYRTKDDTRIKRAVSKDKIHEESPTRKSVHGYPIKDIIQMSQNHSKQEMLVSSHKKPGKAHTAKKKRIHYPEMIFGINPNLQSFHNQQPPQVQQPMMSVYNMGAGPEQVLMSHTSKSSSMVTSNKRSSQSKNTVGDYQIGFVTSDEYNRRLMTEKKEYLDRHHMSYTNGSAVHTDKCLSNQKRMANIVKPVRQHEGGVVRQHPEQQYAMATAQGGQQSHYVMVNSTQAPSMMAHSNHVSNQMGSGLKQSYQTQNPNQQSQLHNDQAMVLKNIPQSAGYPTRNQQRNQSNNLSQSNQFYTNTKTTKTLTAGFKRIHSAGKYSNQKNLQIAKNPQWQLDNTERKPSFQQDTNLSVGGHRLKTVDRADSRTFQKNGDNRYNEIQDRIIYTASQKDYFIQQNNKNFVKIRDLNKAQQDAQERQASRADHQMLYPQHSQTPTPLINGPGQQANIDKVFLKNKQKTISVINPNQTQAQLNFTNQMVVINNNKYKVKSPQIAPRRPGQMNGVVSQSMNDAGHNFVLQNNVQNSIYQSQNIQSESHIRPNPANHAGFLTSQNKTFSKQANMLSVSTQLKPSLTSTNSHEKLITTKQTIPVSSASAVIEPIYESNRDREGSFPYSRTHKKSAELGMNNYGIEEERKGGRTAYSGKKSTFGNAIITSNKQHHTQKIVHEGMKRPKTGKKTSGIYHLEKTTKSSKKKKIIKSRQQIAMPQALEPINEHIQYDSSQLYALNTGPNSNQNGQSRKIKYIGDSSNTSEAGSKQHNNLRQKHNSSNSLNSKMLAKERGTHNNSVGSNHIPEFIINPNI